MEYPQDHPLIRFTNAEMQAVRKEYSMSSIKSINQDIDAILDWYAKQPHLPRVPPERHVIERIMAALGRGSLEITKRKIDMVHTVKSMIPEMVRPRDVQSPQLQTVLELMRFFPLPRLTNEFARVSVAQFMSEDYERFSLMDFFRFAFMVGDFRLKYDYCVGDIFIFDMTNVRFGHLIKMNPIVIKKAEILSQEGYGGRLLAIHIVNAPVFIDKIMNVIKQGLKPKIANRIVVHTNTDDLHRYIPQEVLPKDYGGDEKSMSELAEEWRKELLKEENRQYLIETESMFSDESKRIGGAITNDLLGMPGSFRRLDVD